MVTENNESPVITDFNDSNVDEVELLKNTGNRFSDTSGIFDKLARFANYNPITTALGDAYRGINQNAASLYVPVDNSQYGLVFFTKPRLNLSYYNLTQDRVLTPLHSTDKQSTYAVIRSYLDPVGHRTRNEGSTFVDSQSPWISILTNYIETLSGFPDPVFDTFTTKPGMYREELSMMDAFPVDYSAYDVTCTFKNPKGNVILDLFNMWERYAARVHEGVVNPYPENLFQNIIDYNTRIYRISLDETRRFITNITACGAAFPTTSPLGSMSDYDRNKVIDDQTNIVSVTFRCNGAMYRDPILMEEFNTVTCIFNNAMIGADNREANFVKLSVKERMWFNMEAIPWINLDTSELEWYVSKSRYNEIIEASKIYGY